MLAIAVIISRRVKFYFIRGEIGQQFIESNIYLALGDMSSIAPILAINCVETVYLEFHEAGVTAVLGISGSCLGLLPVLTHPGNLVWGTQLHTIMYDFSPHAALSMRHITTRHPNTVPLIVRGRHKCAFFFQERTQTIQN